MVNIPHMRKHLAIPQPPPKPHPLPKDVALWTLKTKTIMVEAVLQGFNTREEIITRFGLSPEELERWIGLYIEHGAGGLKTTAVGAIRRKEQQSKAKPHG